jgi:hypothetical protein
MIILRRYIFWGIGWLLLLSSLVSYFAFAWSEAWTLSLQIRGFGIRHGTPNNVHLWTPTTSSSDQEISWQFTDNFRIEDLQGYMTGHYTTIQCDGIYGSLGNTLTGIYLKAGNVTPTLLLWNSGNVSIGTALGSYITILTPVTYIYKATDIANAWVANKYWDKPRLKITIPWWTPPGTYSGTIVFSLYMN